MNTGFKLQSTDHVGHHMAWCYTLFFTECDLLVGVCEGVLIHRAGPFLIFLPEAGEFIPAFSKALWVFWLLFQQHRHWGGEVRGATRKCEGSQQLFTCYCCLRYEIQQSPIFEEKFWEGVLSLFILNLTNIPLILLSRFLLFCLILPFFPKSRAPWTMEAVRMAQNIR